MEQLIKQAEEDVQNTEKHSPPIVFRTYIPLHESLREFVTKLESIPKLEAEANFEQAKKRARILSSDDKPFLVPSKRANWDLKRDLEKRMKKLHRRTQNAISALSEELQQTGLIED